jgi:hypothetical protein
MIIDKTGEQNMKILFRQMVIVIIFIAVSASVFADEGMWLYNDVPAQLLKERYGFEPTSAWLEHVQKSSVRYFKPPRRRRRTAEVRRCKTQLLPGWLLCPHLKR